MNGPIEIGNLDVSYELPDTEADIESTLWRIPALLTIDKMSEELKCVAFFTLQPHGTLFTTPSGIAVRETRCKAPGGRTRVTLEVWAK